MCKMVEWEHLRLVKDDIDYAGPVKTKKGLGRWIWLLCKRKNGNHLRVVGAYSRTNPKAEGENTVNDQHQQYPLQQKYPHDLQLACDQDLERAVKILNNVSDHIVIAMDANDNLRNGPIK